MKLALNYYQFIRSGGLENYLIEFATRLKAAGHEIELVTAKIAPEVEAKLGMPVHRISVPTSSRSLAVWRFAQESGKVLSDVGADVSIGFGRTWKHDLHRAGGGCHAIYSRLLPPWKRFAPKNLMELHMEKRLYTAGETQNFITNSERVAAQLQGAYRTAAERFTTIHTAVETQLFRPSENQAAQRADICQKMKTDPAKPVLLFVSLSHRRKGLDALLTAMKKVDATLWIAGKPLGRWYETQIQTLGIGAKVRTVAVTNSLIELYQVADWFVHPTLYDACANTVLQSMACGLPGLISSQDGAVDHICDGMNGFMLNHPRDPEKLVQTIRQALDLTEAERQALGEAARETMEALTWEHHLSCWEKVFSTVQH